MQSGCDGQPDGSCPQAPETAGSETVNEGSILRTHLPFCSLFFAVDVCPVVLAPFVGDFSFPVDLPCLLRWKASDTVSVGGSNLWCKLLADNSSI